MAAFGFIVTAFFILCFAITMLAVRSVWRLRHTRPLTPLRVALILAICPASLIPIGLTSNNPLVVLGLAAFALCASLGWLSLSERFRS